MSLERGDQTHYHDDYDSSPSSSSAENRPSIQELELMREKLSYVVMQAGERVLSYKGPIVDTGEHYGHEQSTIDEHARSVVNNLLDQAFPNIEGIRRFEDRPIKIRLLPSHDHDHAQPASFVFIIDEVDGTTNAKRALANRKKDTDIPRPHASTSIAICSDERLASLKVAAIYAFDSRDCFTAIRAEDGYFAYKNDEIMRQPDYQEAKGDKADRIIVVGYSNNNRLEKGKWEDRLYNEARLRVYEGCRASSIDIISITRGDYDAYVDPRALWGPASGAKLQAYDISAAIGIALGAGFEVSDVYGNDWGTYDLNSEIPIVIARSKRLQTQILRAIQPLLANGDLQERIAQSNAEGTLSLRNISEGG